MKSDKKFDKKITDKKEEMKSDKTNKNSDKKTVNNFFRSVFPTILDPGTSYVCQSGLVAYGRWSLTRIEPHGASSEKRSGHIYFMEDNIFHAISKIRYM